MTTVPEQFISNRPNTWTDWFQTLSSVIPRWGPTPASPPAIGSPAPTSLDDSRITFGPSTAPTLVAFLRHCGCPFAEKEIRNLAQAAEAHPSLRIVIVQHSPPAETEAWFARVRGPELFGTAGMQRVNIVCDTGRTAYAAWGVGVLGWTQMVNGDIMGKLHKQKVTEGLDITRGDWGNYRWQNSGGFAVDAEGTVRWVKIAEDSSDVCDWDEAAASIVKGMA